MQSFTTTVIIRAHRPKVYKALTDKEDLAFWWTPDCEVDATIGGKATFRFEDKYVVMLLEKLVPNREVVWRCIDQNFKFENVRRTNEWLGTVIDFHLVENEDHTTTLQFTHEGLTPKLASYDQTTQLWTYLLHLGLKKYLENKE